MIERILVVCAGNICRSPMVEGILRDRLPGGIEIRSAGIVAPSGMPADPFAVNVCANHGIDISCHRSAPISAENLRWAGLVLAMERNHVRDLVGRHPWSRGRVWLLGHHQGVEFADLLGRSLADFDSFFSEAERALESWMPTLVAQ